ncbi:MAG: hypothetical protein IPJ75_05710 [Ignavibacteriales bacterium]|nr:hypothetical protein [Ignavibacteriales bacterium]
MLKKFALIAFLFTAFFVNTNFAQETFTQPDAQVSVTLPAGWEYETTDKTMMASPKEGGFFVYFKVLSVDDLGVALEQADAILAETVTNMKLGEAKADVVNGMNAISVEGTGDGTLFLLVYLILLLQTLQCSFGRWEPQK